MEIDSERGSCTLESSAPASTKKAQRHSLMDVTSIQGGRRAIKKSIGVIKVSCRVCVCVCRLTRANSCSKYTAKELGPDKIRKVGTHGYKVVRLGVFLNLLFTAQQGTKAMGETI